MFEPSVAPRFFATPLGVDMSTALVDGVFERLRGQPPEALAEVEIYVNSARTQRRLREAFLARGPGFLPRLRLITDLAKRPDLIDVPPAIPPLRLRLQLSRLVGALLDRQPDLAPRSALFDLSDSLADLMGEMQEEGVLPATIAGLDVGEHARHWQRSQTFLSIITPYFGADQTALPVEGRQAAVVDRLAVIWKETPPTHPILIAGSTGSRGPTARLMQAVARLPQGAVILPGLDFDLPGTVWAELSDPMTGEDHPQFRFARLADQAGIAPQDIPSWSATLPVNPARNRLVSLALRPAPVTDQWLAEGPKLMDIGPATDGMTLLEAPGPLAEASAIALRLRRAVDEGIRAVLITPNRELTRAVTAAMDRWGVLPDDSGGQSLFYSAPGRFLRHVAAAGASRLGAEDLLILLKHPLTHTGHPDRGPHLLRTRDLELQLLRRGKAFPTRADLISWAEKREEDPGAVAWAGWVADTVLGLFDPDPLPLSERVARHLQAARAMAAGPDIEDTGELWLREAGQKSLSLMESLEAEADEASDLTAGEYRDMLDALLAGEEAREPLSPHPRIMIWGTLEARVQSADLVILGGLNEGSWPQAVPADPWLNRRMRTAAGLRLPERVIGLSAHDFQQSIAGAEVWLTRSKRDAETETVPSRWLNRITNLMAGASEETAAALADMRARGGHWLALATALNTPRPEQIALPATRPAPCPPVAARPKVLSVTQIEKLIRDPYAIYADKVLGLRPLSPLRQVADPALRGTVLHGVLHDFIDQTRKGVPPDALPLLMRLAEERFDRDVPWPATRRLWLARLARVAEWFVSGEVERRALGRPHLLEIEGKVLFDDLGLTLKGTADRIDLAEDGRVVIYDYKSGSPPSDKQEKAFNKQLWLEAVMALKGGFGAEHLAARIAYIGLGSGGKVMEHPVDLSELAEIEAGFARLIRHYQEAETGFVSRRAMVEVSYDGDYDHLARFGEWDATQAAAPEKVGGL